MRAQVGWWERAGIARRVESAPTIVAPLFCVPKPTGKARTVYNGKRVNKYLRAPRFRLPTPEQVLRSCKPGSFFAKLDLANAFWCIPIHADSQHLLGFKFDNNYYVWQRLPMGINVAPYIMQTLMKDVQRMARELGITHSWIYLDDILIVARTKEAARQQARAFFNLLRHLGFAISEDKCDMEGEQDITYLGLRLIASTNDSTVRLKITDARRLALLGCLRRCNGRLIARKALQQLVGHLNFAASCYPGLRVCFAAAIAAQAEPEDTFPRAFDFSDCINNLRRDRGYRNEHHGEPTSMVFSDATPTAIGFINTKTRRGMQRLHLPAQPVWLRELQAAVLAIMTHRHKSTLALGIDNQAALGMIRKGYSSQRQAWPWLRRLQRHRARFRFALHAFYVRSASNPADVWSRQLLNTSHQFDDGLGGWDWSLRRLDDMLTDNVLDDLQWPR